MSNLKTRGVIKGYRISLELIGMKITGDITYSPIHRVDGVTVGLNLEADENYKRATMGG